MTDATHGIEQPNPENRTNVLQTLAARSRTPRCTSSWRFRSNESSSSRNFICALTDVVVSYRGSTYDDTTPDMQ